MKKVLSLAITLVVATSLVAVGPATAETTVPEDATADVSQSLSDTIAEICAATGACERYLLPEEAELPTDGTELGHAVVLEHGVDFEDGLAADLSAVACSSQTCMYANGEGRYVKYVLAYGYTSGAGCAYGLLTFTPEGGSTYPVSATNYLCYSGSGHLGAYHPINRTFKSDGKLCYQFVRFSGVAPSGRPCVKVFRR